MANILEILLKSSGGEQTKGELGKVSKSTGELDAAFRKLGTYLSVAFVGKIIKDSIDAFGKQAEAVTKLNAVLKAQNQYTEDVSKKLQEQASALQAVTIFGDEATIAGQAFAISMGITADTVEKITPIVLDFASAMNIDLQTAFRVVGQAASGDTGMLKRYGIIVDESKLKSEGFNAILDVMQNNFKGVAQEVAKTGTGPLKQFNNQLGDLQELVGEALVPGLNSLIGTITNLGQHLTGTNKKTEQQADLHKKVTELLRDENTTQQERIQLIRAIKDGNDEMLKTIVKNSEAESKAAKIRVEENEAWKKRREESLKKEQEEEDKRVKGIQDNLVKEYDLRREMRELNLQDVIANIEEQIELETEGSEKRKALEKALSDYKNALGIESAARIKEVQDNISSNLQTNLGDMLVGQKTYQEATSAIWSSLHRMIIDMILKETIEEKAAATIKIAATQAVAAAKAISAYVGIPFVGLALGIAAVAALSNEINKHTFQSGGTVPGAEGEPVLATVHGGEKIITPQQQRRGAGSGVNIQQIIIQFPEVTSFSDWMNASPAVIKQVTERKILQALSSLEDEGKVKEGTVLI